MPSNLEYFNRRLHSLLGVIPIGIFLIQHFVINHFATRGPEAFNQAAHFMESLPFRYALEIFIIFLPIMFHAVYGIFIAFKGKSNTSRYGFFRNWMFLLQRVSGVFLVIFIAWHVWDTRVQAMLGQEVNYEMMANILQNNWMFAFYIVGIVAATFHFANGLWSFAVSWGITVTPKSQKIMTYVSIVVFIALTYVGVASALAFV